MIDRATPYLRLSASESSSDKPTQVRFVAHFGLEDSDTSSWDQTTVQTFYSPYDSNIKLGPKSGPYQLVRISFVRGLWVRMLPSFSDAESIDPQLYDYSAVPCPYEPGQPIDPWLRSFQQCWVQKRSCPDPQMYQVNNSLWLHEHGLINEGLTHYLLLGHDAYVEVIAQSWTWESEGALR
jgi:hypothetical protein